MPVVPSTATTREITGTLDWYVDAGSPSLGAEHRTTIVLTCQSRGTARLTAAGQVAMLAALSAYWTAPKLAALYRRNPNLDDGALLYIDRQLVKMTVLPEDVAGLLPSINGVLQTAANLQTR